MPPVGDQVKVKGPVPPDNVTDPVPLFPPKQGGFVLEGITVRFTGAVKVND